MREMVQRQKANSYWLSVERTYGCTADGIPRGLVCYPLAISTNTPSRIRSRIFAGRTVTLAQAAMVAKRLRSMVVAHTAFGITLTRVLYLNSLTT